MIETDYLVVGAGAAAMAFVDALIDGGDAEVVIVDRRHRPGGHWLDAYPFVRLHMPSANYGVASMPLGADRIDDSGPNAGFYERATGDEIVDYFGRVLDQRLLPSGKVRFLGMSDYLGQDADGHHVVSLLNGAKTTVKVRRRLVDATYVQAEIPARHQRSFAVEDGALCVPPGDLVALAGPADSFTVLGAGKTAMDTCNWLLDAGVDSEHIRWVRPRDPLMFDRAGLQPLELVGSYVQTQARWVEAAGAAESGQDFARRMEASGVFMRLDPEVEPTLYRGAVASRGEVEALRTIRHVVRAGRVRSVGARSLALEEADLPSEAREVYVDCTAAGVAHAEPRPVFEPGRITVQYLTIGSAPWGAAALGAVEARRDDDREKNRLCPPIVFTGRTSDLLAFVLVGLNSTLARAAEKDLAPWQNKCRLNPARAAGRHADDPIVTEALVSLMTNIGPALENLQRRAGTPDALTGATS